MATQTQPVPVDVDSTPGTAIPSSDISDLFDASRGMASTRSRIQDTVVTLVWTGLFLVLMDAGVNFLFAYPQDPSVTQPAKLPLYFEYGRSIEGKLDRMLGETNDMSAPLLRAGWIDDPEQIASLPTSAEDKNGTLIAAYGMSFTFRVCDAAQKLDSTLTVRGRGGPAAPLNHSYALFVDDLGRHEADVAVLGVLASSFPAFNSVSHLTWNFEFPGVYTYPRYYLESGELKTVESDVNSLNAFRDSRRDSDSKNRFQEYLEQNDAFYSPVLFQRNVLDRSVLARLMRRGWWQRNKRLVEARYHTRDGFTNTGGEVDAARLLLLDFANQSRERGMKPIVLLFNDRGYGVHLFEAFGPTLDENGVTFISTHEAAPATDLSNFQGDGHFRADLDEMFAEQLLNLVFDDRK